MTICGGAKCGNSEKKIMLRVFRGFMPHTSVQGPGAGCMPMSLSFYGNTYAATGATGSWLWNVWCAHIIFMVWM